MVMEIATLRGQRRDSPARALILAAAGDPPDARRRVF
jgi:hypothetical protein